MAEARGSLFIPIRFLITNEEHLKRLTLTTRRERWKSINPKHAEDPTPLLSISHPNLLEQEISNLTAEQSAKEIVNHIQKIQRNFISC